MFKTVIVPLDGSELGEAALPYAAALAGKLGAGLTLISVLTEDAAAEDQARLQDYLEKQAGALGPGVEVSVRLGDPVKQIVAATREHQNPMVAMATETVHGLGGLFHTSVSAHVVHDSAVPVLVVRAAPAGPVSFSSIVVPLDGSAFAERALSLAEELAKAFGGELQLIRVAPTTQYYALAANDPAFGSSTFAMNEVTQQLVDEARSFIEEAGKRVSQAGYTVRAEALVGDPAGQIVAYAKERHSDLIVMATHGHGGFSRVLFGSVAEHVLHDAATPLLLVHPSGKVEEDDK